jgi:hypothetical protein
MLDELADIERAPARTAAREDGAGQLSGGPRGSARIRRCEMPGTGGRPWGREGNGQAGRPVPVAHYELYEAIAYPITRRKVFRCQSM